MALIEVQNLTFEYPGKRALEDVSFSIPAGSITALVGPNGAGKTTLMNCLAALARPLSGSLHIQNVSVLEEPRRCHKMLGYLPDSFGLYDELTVEQCLTYMAMAQNIPKEKMAAAIKLAARRVDLSDRLKQKAGQLSRGLRQRLGIAQAIIHNPEVILLDEPASGLDPEARHHLSQTLLELRAEGKTLMVSSHILAELEDYSTHMMVIHDGKLAEHIELGEHKETAHKTLVLHLSEPVEDLADQLAKFSEVVGPVQCEDQQAEFQFEGTAEDQHLFLKALLEAGLPVCGLTVREVNLQEAYLSRFGVQKNAT